MQLVSVPLGLLQLWHARCLPTVFERNAMTVLFLLHLSVESLWGHQSRCRVMQANSRSAWRYLSFLRGKNSSQRLYE
eukprot:5940180-Amphidinium_carterae.1